METVNLAGTQIWIDGKPYIVGQYGESHMVLTDQNAGKQLGAMMYGYDVWLSKGLTLELFAKIVKTIVMDHAVSENVQLFSRLEYNVNSINTRVRYVENTLDMLDCSMDSVRVADKYSDAKYSIIDTDLEYCLKYIMEDYLFQPKSESAFDKLVHEKSELESINDDLREHNETLADQIQDLEQTESDNQDTIDELREQLQGKDDAYKDIQSKYDDAMNDLNDAKRSLEENAERYTDAIISLGQCSKKVAFYRDVLRDMNINEDMLQKMEQHVSYT